MSKAALHLVDEEYAQVVRLVRLEHSCCGIREVAHFLSDALNKQSGFHADFRRAVEGLADGRDGIAAFLRNVF